MTSPRGDDGDRHALVNHDRQGSVPAVVDCDQPAGDPFPWAEAEALLEDIYRRYAAGEQVPEVTVFGDLPAPAGASVTRTLTLTQASISFISISWQ